MFAFTKESEKKIETILAKYPEERKMSALLPFLTLVQRQEGWVSPEAMIEIGKRLDVSPAYVQSVCSFYTMYFQYPAGKYIIRFCHNISCYLNGSDSLLEYLSEKLNLKVGETSEDKRFTLIKEECLAECSAAPVMRVNDDYHVNLTKESIDKIIDSLK